MSQSGPRAIHYHRKRDGILRIAEDGNTRFLTWWETIFYWFGGRP